MFSQIVLVAVLAVLYGFAWHNQPANPGESRPGRQDRV